MTGRNSRGAPIASPHARPTKQPMARSSKGDVQANFSKLARGAGEKEVWD